MVTSDDVLRTIGYKIKQARLSKKFTQDFVAENIDISTDLLRNIENCRNIGSIPTLLNICNFLEISPNYLFSELPLNGGSVWISEMATVFLYLVGS